MKTKNLVRLSILLTLPLLLSAKRASLASAGGYYTGFTIDHLFPGTDNTFDIYYESTADETRTHELSLFVRNSLTEGLHYEKGACSDSNIYAPFYYEEYVLAPHQRITITCVLPGAYVDTNNIFQFYDKNTASTFIYSGSMRNYIPLGQEAKEIVEGSSTKGNTRIVVNGGKITSIYPEVSFKGFEKSYDASSGNIVPLSKMVFTSKDWMNNTFIPMDDANLKLTITGVGATQFSSMNNGVPVRRGLTLKAKFVPGENEGEWVVALPDKKFVVDSLSGVESNYVPEKGGVITRDLYLPRQSSSLKTYTFTLTNYDDATYYNYSYSFSVTADYNFFGNCTNSDWCVGMA